jgi:hypothetical protein
MMLTLACLSAAAALGPALKYGRLTEDMHGSCGQGGVDCGEALDLSAMLANGMAEQAKNDSLVKGIGNVRINNEPIHQ